MSQPGPTRRWPITKGLDTNRPIQVPPVWKNLRRDTGSLSPGKIGGHKKPTLSGANADWLRRRIRPGPFTLRKLTQELAARGIKTDVRAVWTFVHAEGLSFKKNDPSHRTRASRRR